MKRLLIVYDCMMTGGTTTALLSLLNAIDYGQYHVDMLMFTNTGPFLNMIPRDVSILSQAFRGNEKILSVSKRKIFLTLLNGNAIQALMAYRKYKGTPKGNLKTILMHFGIKAQVAISRSISEHYDVAIGFIEGWADQYVLSPKVKANKKIIWIHPDYQNSYLIPEIDQRLFKIATNIVTVSHVCKEHMRNAFPEYSGKILCIENINSAEFIRKRSMDDSPLIKKGKINFCTIARCDMDVKGLDRFLHVLFLLKRNHKIDDVIWHYIGNGRDFSALQNMVKEYDLEENVICYGQKNNPLVYLKQMDYFVLTSRYEGRPVSVDEAIALGIPCIVTSYVSSAEQIHDHVTGLICSNDEKGIYDAINMVVSSPELKNSFKKNIVDFKSNKNESMNSFYDLIQADQL